MIFYTNNNTIFGTPANIVEINSPSGSNTLSVWQGDSGTPGITSGQRINLVSPTGVTCWSNASSPAPDGNLTTAFLNGAAAPTLSFPIVTGSVTAAWRIGPIQILYGSGSGTSQLIDFGATPFIDTNYTFSVIGSGNNASAASQGAIDRATNSNTNFYQPNAVAFTWSAIGRWA
jgi:hypothetical protein